MNWLESYEKDKKKAGEKKLQLIQKMHDDKMNILKDLVNVLKQS